MLKTIFITKVRNILIESKQSNNFYPQFLLNHVGFVKVFQSGLLNS